MERNASDNYNNETSNSQDAFKHAFISLLNEYVSQGMERNAAAARALVQLRSRVIPATSPTPASASLPVPVLTPTLEYTPLPNPPSLKSTVEPPRALDPKPDVKDAAAPIPALEKEPAISAKPLNPPAKIPPTVVSAPEPALTPACIRQLIQSCEASNAYTVLIRAAGSFFRSIERLEDSYSPDSIKGVDPESKGDPSRAPSIGNSTANCQSSGINIDIQAVHEAYTLLLACPSEGVGNSIGHALEYLASNLLLQAETCNIAHKLKPFLIILEYPKLVLDVPHHSMILMHTLTRALQRLPTRGKLWLVHWWRVHCDSIRLTSYIQKFHLYINHCASKQAPDDARTAVRALALLWAAWTPLSDTFASVHAAVSCDVFKNQALNKEYIQTRQGRGHEYISWIKDRDGDIDGTGITRQAGAGGLSSQARQMATATASATVSGVSRTASSGGTDAAVGTVPYNTSSATTTSDTKQSGSNTSAVTGHATSSEMDVSVTEAVALPPINMSKVLDDLQAALPAFVTVNFDSFISYPFLLTAQSKSLILEIDGMYRQRQEHDREMQGALARGQQTISTNSLYLILRVRREFLIADTLSQIPYFESQDFRKELKVVFDEEDGVDAGGVKKEYFQLMMKRLLDPAYGMFKYYSDTRLLWFSSDCLEQPSEYELVGLLTGIAIYNGVILDLSMPSVLYKKLKNITPTLADLAVLQPDLAQGLQALLDYDGDVAATFSQTFEITFERYGEVCCEELVAGGAEIVVDNVNREAYVAAYVTYLLDKSVAPQFNAFAAGFRKVCNGAVMDFFSSAELELLICGGRNLNFQELRAGTVYQDGYNADDTAIGFFWDVLFEFNEQEKRTFLKFVTGSDRCPIDGLAQLKMTVSKNTDENSRLPSAHTCFNHLLLPAYSSVSVMRERVRFAMENTEGFGLR